MKRVLKNHDEVAHIWASQSQAEGRAGNMFFEGASIFSWGRHFEIARVHEKQNAVLFTSRGYSSSTAKHKSITWRAIPSRDYQIFIVPRVEGAPYHGENVTHLIKQIKENKTRALRAVSLTDLYMQGAENARGELRRYVKVFSRAMLPAERKEARAALAGLLWTKAESAKLEKRAASQVERAAAAQKRAALRREVEAAKAAEKLAEWRAGADVAGAFHLLPVALRLSAGGYDVETSHGARVPLNDARRFWLALKKNEAQSGDNIGAFELREVAADHVRIGCHNISRAEMDAFACAQGWTA